MNLTVKVKHLKDLQYFTVKISTATVFGISLKAYDDFEDFKF